VCEQCINIQTCKLFRDVLILRIILLEILLFLYIEYFSCAANILAAILKHSEGWEIICVLMMS
jgi:hypothetical protein